MRRLELVVGAFRRQLVGAPAQQPRGMPESALLELVEVHLADQRRLQRHPGEVLRAGPAAGAAGGAARTEAAASLERRQLGQQLAALAGAGPRGMAHLVEPTGLV